MTPGTGKMTTAILEGLLARAKKKSARDVLAPPAATAEAGEGETEGQEGISEEDLEQLVGMAPDEGGGSVCSECGESHSPEEMTDGVCADCSGKKTMEG